MKRYAAIAALAAFALILSNPLLRGDDIKPPLLKRGATIKIAGARGKFDLIEVDPVYHRLLAAHEMDGTADFINLDDNTLIARVQSNPVQRATDMVLVTKLDKYFISGSLLPTVIVVDAKTLKVTSQIDMPGNIDSLIYEPKNDRIYVTNDHGTHLWAIDPNTQKIVGDVEFIGDPECMVYDPAADRIYLNSKSTDEIFSIDPNINKVVATWSVKPATGPHGLAFDPKTNRLFSAGLNGKLAVVDARTGKLITSVDTAPYVDQAIFEPSTRRIYCACAGKMSVVQETEEGAKFLGNVPTAPTSKNVAVDPKTHSIWSCYTDGKDSYAQEYIQQ